MPPSPAIHPAHDAVAAVFNRSAADYDSPAIWNFVAIIFTTSFVLSGCFS